jgi:hypothetical protein
MAVVSGGTTLIDNGALDAGVPTGNLILLETQTASASASIEFTSGIDSTYDSYVFKFIDIHPQNDSITFGFNFSTDGGSTYNVAKTSTTFVATHDESGSPASLSYNTFIDLANGTGNQIISTSVGNDNDQSYVGTLQLFNPSSSVFVKHFIVNSNEYQTDDRSANVFTAGYGNTTSPINAIKFLFGSGNIDDGIIKMYGVK